MAIRLAGGLEIPPSLSCEPVPMSGQAFVFFAGVECPDVEVHGTRNVLDSQERI
jgi:hypothetical protein